MTLSSLQRAVASTQKPKPENQTPKGAFESSFAGGLDLSEFANAVVNRGPSKSAAAELLRIKTKEKEQREKTEAEERIMEEIIRKRVSNLATQGPSNSIVVDALVKMHGSEMNERSSKKKISGSRKSGSFRNSQPSKPFAKKKSRRSKY